MTIEDSLNKIEVTVEKEQSKEQSKPEIKDEITQVLETYISDFQETHPESKYSKFNIKQVQIFAPYLRFLPDLSIQIGPIPKKNLIELLKQKSQEFSKLAEQTNITDQIKEETTLITGEFNAIISTPEVQKALNIDQLVTFQNRTKNYFIINSLDFLSLFIGQGKMLRAYWNLKKDKKENKRILEMDTGSRLLRFDDENYGLAFRKYFTPLGIKELRNFCETQNEKEIKDLLNQLSELTNTLYASLPLDKITHQFGYEDYYFGRSHGTMKKNLFAKLKKYNPQLTAGETNVN
ncbi:hypothetical protein HZA97_09255 [Candidatus Woesearchaeota archaeon]|nr:hypothetical protein [Candidatus Woesearchaeota archaeon]